MNQKFSVKETIAYGLGAVGKDMVYALSASYVMYYYQDILGLSGTFVGLILMIARVFDAANDPFMGVVVAKTHGKQGRFRPWIITGTVLNAFILYALFAAPNLKGAGLMIYFGVIYILWGITYTMMDIPFWSMIPAVTDNSKDREKLSVVGRTCAGVGNALITVFTVKAVQLLGGNAERIGFRNFALIVAVLFIVFELILFLTFKEKPVEKAEIETTTVKEMFQALFKNDQALVTVVAIILIDCALYITSNLIIYFFKYDIGATSSTWQNSYTLFSTVGGGMQILAMMLVYPLLRKKFSNTTIFRFCLVASITGYAFILIFCLTGLANNLPLLLVPGALVFGANGILTVLTTVFLSNTVDYGEKITGHRDESVIFSMQTFVVKASSGFAVFVSGVGLDAIGLVGNNSTEGDIVLQSASTLNGLHFLMTVLPIIGLVIALIVFNKKFILTDEKAEEIAEELRFKHAQNG